MKRFKFSQVFGRSVIKIIYRFIISNYDITDEDIVFMTLIRNQIFLKIMI